MLCTTTVSPSRMKDSMASSWGAFDILARRFVGEDLIERHALKLAIDIPWLVSNSSLSQCSHYVWKIVVWRTNLEVTPATCACADNPSSHPRSHIEKHCLLHLREIGQASGRERVFQYV